MHYNGVRTIIGRLKASALVFFTLALILVCACENDTVTPQDQLSGWHFSGIYIGSTDGLLSVAGTPNYNKVVLCYEYNARVYYRVGTVNPGSSVSWGGGSQFGNDAPSGDIVISPQVAVSDNGVVICALQTGYWNGTPAGKVWVGIGTINGNSINWLGWSYANIPGYYPSVAITRDGKYAVLVYQGSNNGGAIYYSVTPIDTNSNTLQWSASTQFAMGHRPSIAMNDKDQIICIFNSWQNNSGLWYTSGQFWRENSTLETFGTYSFGESDKTKIARPCITMGDQMAGQITDVFALAPQDPKYLPGEDTIYLGQMNQVSNMNWVGSEYIATWRTTASICNSYQNTMIEVYEDGNDPTKMYYFIFGGP